MKKSLGTNGVLPSLSPDVEAYLKDVFHGLDDQLSIFVAENLTVHEPAIDDRLITLIREGGYERKFESGFSVAIDAAASIGDLRGGIHVETYRVSGGRHWGGGEVADLGLVATYQLNGQIVRVKFCLIQTKRLYPLELQGGVSPSGIKRSIFRSDFASEYKALEIGGEQYVRIKDFETELGIPVFYGFYNPIKVPVYLPNAHSKPVYLRDAKPFGVRIMPAAVLRNGCDKIGRGIVKLKHLLESVQSPFKGYPNLGGWSLPVFVVDKFLPCIVGTVYRDAGQLQGVSEAVFPGIFEREGGLVGVVHILISYTAP